MKEITRKEMLQQFEDAYCDRKLINVSINGEGYTSSLIAENLLVNEDNGELHFYDQNDFFMEFGIDKIKNISTRPYDISEYITIDIGTTQLSFLI